MTRLSGMLLAFVLALGGPAAAQTVDEVMAEAKADCASFENGVLTVLPDAVTEIELSGAAPAEVLIDWAKFDCSSMASLWGGTGGSTLTILAAGVRTDHLALGWKLVGWDEPVLLLALHGGECGATGSEACVEALVWGDGRLLSMRTPDAADAEGDDAPAGSDAAMAQSSGDN